MTHPVDPSGTPNQTERYNPLFEAVDKFSKEIVGSAPTTSVQRLFQKFLNLPIDEQMQCVNTVLLAKCLSDSGTNPQVAIEFIKEFGRNARALLASERGGSGSEDIPPWL